MPEATVNLLTPASLSLVIVSASTSVVRNVVRDTHMLPLDQVLPRRERHYYYSSFEARNVMYEDRQLQK